VDLIVAGHTHAVVNTKAAGIPLVEAGWGGTSVAVVDIVRNVVGAREIRTAVIPVPADGVRPDTAIRALIARYRPQVDSVARRVIAQLKFPLARKGPQYPLGNLIADAERNALRVDLALVSNAAIRTDLPPGPVTYGQLYALAPDGNRLAKVTVTGAQFRKVLEQILAGEEPSGHVSGALVRYDPSASPNRRVREVTLADGGKLDDGRRYTLVVSEALTSTLALAGLPTERQGMTDLDALITYLRRLPQPVSPPEEKRITAQ
jgi:2',3'-cyclic-nucleotide 2'-phosphodiesterase (5'-nucleotidase family)